MESKRMIILTISRRRGVTELCCCRALLTGVLFKADSSLASFVATPLQIVLYLNAFMSRS